MSRVEWGVRREPGRAEVEPPRGLAGEFVTWFESDDIELTSSGAAQTSAYLIPALDAGLALEAKSPVDDRFIENLPTVRRVLREWWGYDEPAPILRRGSAAGPVAGRQTALAFSGGVDSFYTLLCSGPSVDVLVFVWGFDIDIDDTRLFNEYLPSLEAVAGATGKRLAVVRTNLRREPVFGAVDWVRTHGGALAAVGHLLAPEVGRFVISSTFDRSATHSYGSSWRLDPYWSSAATEIVHWGESVVRYDKIPAVGAQPLAQAHLRTCWQHLPSGVNCGRCCKCLRVELTLLRAGHLPAMRTFPQDVSLVQRLDALAPEASGHAWDWRMLQEGLPDEILAAVERVVARIPAGQVYEEPLARV